VSPAKVSYQQLSGNYAVDHLLTYDGASRTSGTDWLRPFEFGGRLPAVAKTCRWVFPWATDCSTSILDAHLSTNGFQQLPATSALDYITGGQVRGRELKS
jgi:hypothetical protein